MDQSALATTHSSQRQVSVGVSTTSLLSEALLLRIGIYDLEKVKATG